MTTYSGFGAGGLPVGTDTTNLTYLYGISDFFSVMFEDTGMVNLMLEATSESAASIYSKFLQMTSSISLKDIEDSIGSTIKLVVIKNSDEVEGKVNTFTLPIEIVGSKFIANRPLLPTTSLEDNVNYHVSDGEITLYKPLSELGFPARKLADGTTEYAMWFVDAEVDEQLIYKHYAKLIGVDPATSTEVYKSFVYGLYYMYYQGPTLSILRKGLNLCLGIPLARESEEVIDVRQYLDTDQYIVITDKNKYVLPYGLLPSVLPGDILSVSDELSQWVEIKDWVEDGDWWINLSIPPSIIPSLPETQTERYATLGSNFDYLMRTYIKNHTFLVNVKVSTFKNNQNFQQIEDIINRVKPLYSQAIYIWSIPYLEETITSSDDTLTQRRDKLLTEDFSFSISRMVRDNTRILWLAPGDMMGDSVNFDTAGLPISDEVPVDCILRGTPSFMRMNASSTIDRLFKSGLSMRTGDQTVTGIVNLPGQYSNTLSSDAGWLNTLFTRGENTLRAKRSVVAHVRGIDNSFGEPALTGFMSTGLITADKSGLITADKRVVPMYIVTDETIAAKCSAMSVAPPSSSRWSFNLLARDLDQSINSVAINSAIDLFNYKPLLVAYFNIIFSRTTSQIPSSPFLPRGADFLWLPSYPTDLRDGDLVIGVRIVSGLVGVYLVTSNFDLEISPYKVIEDTDPVIQQANAPMARGLGPMLSPVYSMRGRGVLSYNTLSNAINEDGQTTTVDTEYLDANNTPRQILRDGSALVHKVVR